jgi:hypothetical protein
VTLYDWERTRDKILNVLQEKGRTKDWLANNVLLGDELPEDLDSLIDEMKLDGMIRHHYSTIHLVSQDSRERHQESRERGKSKDNIANPWVWYAMLPDSTDFRQQLRQNFTAEDGRVFKALGVILLNERRPRVGERVAGPVTIEEQQYIHEVNELLFAYVSKRKEL